MHPESPCLIDFVEERLSRTAREAVHQHLDGNCIRCERRIQTYRHLVACLGQGSLPGAPERLVSAAISLFPQRRRRPPTRPMLPPLRTLPLVFDSYTTEEPRAAVRSADPARYLRFAGRGVEVDVKIERQTTGVRLTAQAIDPASTPLAHCEYQIVEARHELIAGTCDALGGFAATVPWVNQLEILLATPSGPVRMILPATTLS